ncbi:hypothetical protein K525DRAFT_249403 [Schizophyllum commune Loenen D]|nr:hypothetical protein K525DRAFT_249403 [Schizophyllum commune Loenen D]
MRLARVEGWRSLGDSVERRSATRGAYDESMGESTTLSGQLLARVSYSTSAMSAPSDTFSTKFVKPMQFANGATTSARILHPGDVALIISLLSAVGSQLERVGQHYVHASAPASSFVLVVEVFNKLVTVVPSSDASDTSHVNWAHLPSRLSSVLGEDWALRFKGVNASDGCARAFFRPAAPGSSGSIRVNVSVHTVVTDGGAVDVERSAAATVDRVIDILGSTDREPKTLRMRGEQDEFGDWSLQYGADIGVGRILVGVGNTVVGFACMASTAALEEHVQRLLHHVVRRDTPPLRMPVLRSGRLVSSGLDRDATDLQESSSGVDGPLATAGATCESGALLLDKYTIEQD